MHTRVAVYKYQQNWGNQFFVAASVLRRGKLHDGRLRGGNEGKPPSALTFSEVVYRTV